MQEISTSVPSRQAAAVVLIVEDDPSQAGKLATGLRQAGYRVLLARSARTALELLSQVPVDVTLTSTSTGDANDLDLIQEIRRRDQEADVIAVRRGSSVENAVEALRCGGADSLEQPVDSNHLRHTLDILVERRRLRRRKRILELGRVEAPTFHGMVSRNRQMLEVFTIIERLARYPTTALISGESGTGKSLAARALHACSRLSDRPFLVCNCSALPSDLIESELFGHVRDAFAGAERDHVGLFEMASGGTIFLDDIDELPVSTQVQLLRVVENHEIRPVGSTRTISVDTRIIAATSRDLAKMVAEGTFREDLFYRLNVGAIEVPPLRERLEDLPILCDHILAATTRRLDIENCGITEEAVACLQRYEWPGNLRELANVLERGAIMARGEVLGEEHLPNQLRTAPPEISTAGACAFTPELSLRGAERDQIRRALRRSGGKRVEAAKLLGLSRRTLYRKLDKYGIQ